MNEQTNGPLKPAAPNQGNGPDRKAGRGDTPRLPVNKAAGRKNEAVLGPFTIRDLTVFGSTLILFIASLIPMFAVLYNLWNLGSLFFLGLGIVLPVIVAGLFVARRLSPEIKIRIGSLSVDQFGSVVASFAVAFFFLSVAGAYVPSMLLALIGALGLFSATVLGRLIPVFSGDFQGRTEVPAHVVARESAVPARKPRAPKAPAEASVPAEAAVPADARDSTAPKATGPHAVAGWAKRLTSAGQSAPGATAAAAGTAATAAAGPGSAAAGAPVAPDHESSLRAPSPAPAAGSQETRTSGAAAPGVPFAEEQTQAAAVVPSATKDAPVTPAPDSVSRAVSAADQTRVADLPAVTGSNAPTTVNPRVRQQEPIGATVDPAHRPGDDADRPAHEAFWFAVAQPRTAFDEHSGAPAFVVEPGGWVLALEDRGHEFLVQHTDGRVGVLRDLSNIERG